MQQCSCELCGWVVHGIATWPCTWLGRASRGRPAGLSHCIGGNSVCGTWSTPAWEPEPPVWPTIEKLARERRGAR